MQDAPHPGQGPEIWMINQYSITPDLPGGTRHYDFGCELVKSGYRVRIFASDVNLALRTHTKLRNGELWREENVNGVRFVWVRAAEYRINNWRRAWNMLSFAANVLRVGLRLSNCRPRTIIGSSPHPFAALGAWALAKLKRAHFVLELRDLWPQA
ncbi:MAG: glycosyltransferase, partial [Bacteroidota bacterium]